MKTPEFQSRHARALESGQFSPHYNPKAMKPAIPLILPPHRPSARRNRRRYTVAKRAALAGMVLTLAALFWGWVLFL